MSERRIAELGVQAACSSEVKSRRGKHSQASEFHKIIYDKYVFCGSENNLTLAHLITEIQSTDRRECERDFNFDVFGPPHTYGLDTKSPRNFLRLCGTQGEMFDNFRWFRIYNPFQSNY